jgi:transcriptional regulator with XRE-family HTH domain
MAMQRIPPMVPLRALREAHGLTTPELAIRIAEFGVTVHADSLVNVELGHKAPSRELLTAWARALNVKPLDIRRPEELAEIFADSTRTECRSVDHSHPASPSSPATPAEARTSRATRAAATASSLSDGAV